MIDTIWLIAAAAGLGGALAGLVGGYAIGRRDVTQARAHMAEAIRDLHEVQAAAQQAAILEDRVADESAARADAERQLSEVQARAEERHRAMARQVDELKNVRAQMETQFKTMINAALTQSRDDFLKQAQAHFDKHQAHARSDLEGLVRPMAQTLEHYRQNLKEIETARQNAYGSLTSELRSVAAAQKEVKEEAARLSTALRSGSGVRGRWGESQLRRIMELAGMAPYVDFTTQTSTQNGGTQQRPDAVIHLPGKRAIVIDAKTPMSAFLEAQATEDPRERDAKLAQHAAQVRTQVRALSKKSYWSAFGPGLEAVVMFLPGDDLIAAAVEQDPTLYEEAFANQVILATPATLFALARAVAHVWTQEQMAERAHDAARLGRELYDRITTMAGHITRLGTALDRSVGHYNSFVNSLERRVLPTARKFESLGILDQRPPLDTLTTLAPTAAALDASEFKAAADASPAPAPAAPLDIDPATPDFATADPAAGDRDSTDPADPADPADPHRLVAPDDDSPWLDRLGDDWARPDATQPADAGPPDAPTPDTEPQDKEPPAPDRTTAARDSG
ncbi:DNA recombination protein RmuC [Rhodothalassium salexigens DSM 2132]|uniref:DNA recombination protein RmuC homolog n=1 Tax=Rhodothalassium salexigens DSM 2132 TaxID=1188247 RepID=A0A4R2PCV1_RHOSA|nr:DNA recombination protein RmuC [Rhodothalassium salexigens]MBB4212139.1 DNA recombination protein RmuC [Rhodothalassium salexigens DSM 2132]MBK1638193.1 hypothetical protein [Rhodothalassium salexigens DSM 2132]TCP33013.1 DNA recombination protein RmuC [Rhodothalassium salexigens DSM 2132]